MNDQLERLTDEVRLLFNALVLRGEQLHGDGPLTIAQRAVLEFLLKQGASTVPQIARRRRVSRQHIQMLVNPLLEAGWIARVENPEHKRSSLVRLTESGVALIGQYRARESAYFSAHQPETTPEELALATDVLRRVRAVVDLT